MDYGSRLSDGWEHSAVISFQSGNNNRDTCRTIVYDTTWYGGIGVLELGIHLE